MLRSCTHVATVGVKGLMLVIMLIFSHFPTFTCEMQVAGGRFGRVQPPAAVLQQCCCQDLFKISMPKPSCLISRKLSDLGVRVQ